MGMFDYIRFECEFILPHLQDMSFQTKDFYKMMDDYVVSKNGRLLLEDGVDPLADEIFIQYSGLANFTGFYLSPDGQDVFYDLQAGFDNGILVFISILEERTLEDEIV